MSEEKKKSSGLLKIGCVLFILFGLLCVGIIGGSIFFGYKWMTKPCDDYVEFINQDKYDDAYFNLSKKCINYTPELDCAYESTGVHADIITIFKCKTFHFIFRWFFHSCFCHFISFSKYLVCINNIFFSLIYSVLHNNNVFYLF